MPSQVIVQEGPGWIIDQHAYRLHLRKFGMDEDKHRECGRPSTNLMCTHLRVCACVHVRVHACVLGIDA